MEQGHYWLCVHSCRPVGVAGLRGLARADPPAINAIVPVEQGIIKQLAPLCLLGGPEERVAVAVVEAVSGSLRSQGERWMATGELSGVSHLINL